MYDTRYTTQAALCVQIGTRIKILRHSFGRFGFGRPALYLLLPLLTCETTAHARGCRVSPRGNRLRGVRRTGRTSRPARLVAPPAPRPGHSPGPGARPRAPPARRPPERPPARALEKMLKALQRSMAPAGLIFEPSGTLYLRAVFTPQLCTVKCADPFSTQQAPGRGTHAHAHVNMYMLHVSVRTVQL